jgi:hypothetical protein
MSVKPNKTDLPLDHALHNEACCNFLKADGLYLDWVVTTAFYAALHFLKHKAFPLNEDGQTHADFDSYCNYLKKRHHINSTIHPHEVLRSLAERRFPKITVEYENLFDLCRTARYHNYKLDERFVKEALNDLAAIKKFCYNPTRNDQVLDDGEVEPPSVRKRARRPRI